MYYNDALSVYVELTGASTTTVLPAGTRYIVGASIQQSGVASQSEIKCGNSTIAKNYGKDWPYNDLMFRCTDAVTVTKTGQDSASYVITYINRDLRTEGNISTGSAVMSFDNNTNIAIGNVVYLVGFMFLIIILLKAVDIGSYIFKK